MHSRILYEYAIIRIVPRVEREEFVNAGVLLYAKQSDYLGCSFKLFEHKVLALHPEADVDLLRTQLEAFARIAAGDKTCKSSIARQDTASRFRWLSANRSTIIQCSPIHPGYAISPEQTLEELMRFYVL